MVMRVDVLVACMESLDETAAQAGRTRSHRVLLTPQGAPFSQMAAERLSKLPALMLISGRYEGFDDRVRTFVDEELSLGDFVLTGGEVPAMAVIEACIRLLPGVLGNEASTREESHSPETQGLLEYPQYTRPAEFRGQAVPPPLVSGNHAKIDAWRREQALSRTKERRPDILARAHEPGKPNDD
jgi:tRNA (guanine37-N1)-methyltransferase